jgi:hypothetical protein
MIKLLFKFIFIVLATDAIAIEKELNIHANITGNPNKPIIFMLHGSPDYLQYLILNNSCIFTSNKPVWYKIRKINSVTLRMVSKNRWSFYA